jgi:hypothetical protein
MTYQDLRSGGITYKNTDVYLTTDEIDWHPKIMIRFGNQSRCVNTTFDLMTRDFSKVIKMIDKKVLTFKPLMRKEKIKRLRKLINL